MKKLVILFLSSLLGFTAYAQDDKTSTEETPATSGFEFTNTGTSPLIISRVYSSCGCTIPKKPEDPILPGETGEIEVKYDTKRVGPIRKTISVYSNAGKVPHPLKIKGTITASKDENKK